MIKSKNIVAIIDIGTVKLTAILIKRNYSGDSEVIATAQQPSKGIRAGMIINLDDAQKALINVIEDIEEKSGEKVKVVYVSLNSSFLSSNRISEELTITNQTVTIKELNKMLFKVLDRYGAQESEVIHTIPYEYILDGNRGIQHPLGLYGNKLSGYFHLISIPLNNLINISKCLENCHFSVEGYIAGGYAAGVACLRSDEMEFGAAVIELGGGATTISVFYKNNIIFTEGVPYGGVHITRDIAKVLDLDIDIAEKIKNQYGSVLNDKNDNKIAITNNDEEERFIRQSDLDEIVAARMDEIIGLLKDKANDSDMMGIINKVVIVGGGSFLIGIEQLVSSHFGKRVRVGSSENIANISSTFLGPNFVTATGMIRIIGKSQNLRAKSRSNEKHSLIKSLWLWLKENF